MAYALSIDSGDGSTVGPSRSGELVIGCRRIKQGLPQGLRGDNLRQRTEAARFLAVPRGRVVQSGGVPIGHDFLPEAQSTKDGSSNGAEAKCIEQGFPEFRHVRQPPSSLPRTMKIIRARQKSTYCELGTESNQSWRHGRRRKGIRCDQAGDVARLGP
jgi:hypothetical protein